MTLVAESRHITVGRVGGMMALWVLQQTAGKRGACEGMCQMQAAWARMLVPTFMRKFVPLQNGTVTVPTTGGSNEN